MDLHGFSQEQAGEILALARERQDFVQEQLQDRISRGEIEVTDADGVQTMANYDKFWQ